jgi:asparagine synthase (glutamine-hydrolysing)
MCGIAGEVGRSAQEARLGQMCDRLRHRGPDDEGRLVEDGVALGMRRLAIIDVAHGQQPVYNEDRSVAVVFNGEIYNYRDLRRELVGRGHRFATESDSEVIAHLYEERGPRLVEHLRGMFAIAVWDRSRRRLVLARDRVGKKPLLYAETSDGLVFASELKALLGHPAVGRTVDLDAVDHYLTLQYVPAPWSALEGVRKLPPATVLVHEDGRSTLSTYWELDRETQTPLSRPQAVERTRELIREATALRLVSERPLGAFLSGGVDSSLVVAAMAEATSAPVKTFSIGFDDPRYDERRYARTVARAFGTEHHELVVSPDPLSTLESIAEAYDEPFADSSAVPSLEVARLTRQHVTVALNGDGGDESFGGYTRYAYNAGVDRLPPLARRILTATSRLVPASAGPRTRAGQVRRVLSGAGGDPASRYLRLMSYFDEPSKRELYSAAMRARLPEGATPALFRRWWDSSRAPDTVGRMLDVDVRSYLPGDLLVKVDIATMRHSLEGRSPLLDHVLMEFAASLPSSWKVHGRRTKVLLKDAARGWIPDEVIDRPKMGFGVPIASWLRADLRDAARDLLTDGTARQRGWFDQAAVQQLLAEHDAGIDRSPRIWALIVLEQWHRRWIDSASPTPATTDALSGR